MAIVYIQNIQFPSLFLGQVSELSAIQKQREDAVVEQASISKLIFRDHYLVKG